MAIPVQEKVPSEQNFILVWGAPFLSVKRNDKKILEHRFGEMMRAGVHFGHGTRKWNPRMAPYICKA